MSLNIFPRLFNKFQTCLTMLSSTRFHTISSITSSSIQSNNILAGGAWSVISTRTNIRNHFPRAKETKRIKVHGWLKRMSTVTGRRVLMRRILKGRHVLSH